MAALTAHPSLKHCVVVDEDIDIFKSEDIEYAIATGLKVMKIS
jgi:UbiD family decarboxylase